MHDGIDLQELTFASPACNSSQVIEIHNETRLIENRYFSSVKAAEEKLAAEGSKKRKPAASAVKVTKGISVCRALARRLSACRLLITLLLDFRLHAEEGAG